MNKRDIDYHKKIKSDYFRKVRLPIDVITIIISNNHGHRVIAVIDDKVFRIMNFDLLMSTKLKLNDVNAKFHFSTPYLERFCKKSCENQSQKLEVDI